MPTRREFLTQTAAGIATASSIQLAQAAADRKKSSKGGKASPTEPLQLAIVGTGQISQRYLKQAAAGNRARFVATCARTIDEAKARGEEYGITAWFDDYNAMYDKVKPDGVVVATPTAVHAAPTIAALERGIPVLCEKPMAATYEECQAMVAASQKSGAVFLALPFNLSASILTALQYINEATLGAFTGAEAQLLLPGPGRNNWYYDKKVAGGGAMLDTLVYSVSQLITLLGPAKSVTAFANTLIPHRLVDNGEKVESDVDDNVTLIVQWAGGQQAVLRALWGTSFTRFNDAAIYGRQGTLWFAGKDLILHSPKKAVEGGEPIVWNGRKDCYKVPAKPLQNVTGEGLIDHFVDCIVGRAQPTCGGEETLHVHEILFKAYQASSTGRAQQLTTTFKPWHTIDPSFYDTRSRFI